jgi:GntR family transcriptional regulator
MTTPAPRYRELARELLTGIRNGLYPAGTPLPSYTALIDRLGGSRATISEAIRTLEAHGWVQPVHGKGVIVRDRAGRRRLTRGTEIVHTPEAGYRFPAAAATGEKWIAHGTPHASLEPVPERVAGLLGLDEGTPVLRRRRVMSPEGEQPWSVTDTWVPPHVVAEAPQASAKDTGPGGVLRRIEEDAGHGPLTWTQYARADMPGEVEARLLGISPWSAVMELVRVGVSARTGGVVEVTVSVVASDRIELETRLVRGPSAQWPLAAGEDTDD